MEEADNAEPNNDFEAAEQDPDLMSNYTLGNVHTDLNRTEFESGSFNDGDRSGDGLDIQKQFADIMEQQDLKKKEIRVLLSYLENVVKKNTSDIPLNQGKNTKKRGATKELTQAQKLEILTTEFDSLNEQLAQDEAANEKAINNLEAKITCAKQRYEETKRESFEFHRLVVEPAKVEHALSLESSLGSSTRKQLALKAPKIDEAAIIRYYQQDVTQKNALLEKLKRSTVVLEAKIAALQDQKEKKQQQGESLHSIDYYQLQIKNTQFNQRIVEKSKELLKLKSTAGRTVQTLDLAKRSLGNVLKETRDIQIAIKKQRENRSVLSQELDVVQREVTQLQRQSQRKHRVETSNPLMPQIQDYINQKANLYDLQQAVKNWERKIEIAEMGVTRAKKEMRQLLFEDSGADAAGESKSSVETVLVYDPQTKALQSQSMRVPPSRQNVSRLTSSSKPATGRSYPRNSANPTVSFSVGATANNFPSTSAASGELSFPSSLRDSRNDSRRSMFDSMSQGLPHSNLRGAAPSSTGRPASSGQMAVNSGTLPSVGKNT